MSDSFVTPWTVACQAPLSMGILQARILELPFPSPGDLSDSGIEPTSPALQVDSLPLSYQGCPEFQGDEFAGPKSEKRLYDRYRMWIRDPRKMKTDA